MNGVDDFIDKKMLKYSVLASVITNWPTQINAKIDKNDDQTSDITKWTERRFNENSMKDEKTEFNRKIETLKLKS